MIKQSKLKKPISKLLSTALLLTTILSPTIINPQQSHATPGHEVDKVYNLSDLSIGDLVYDPKLPSAEGGQMKFEVVDKNYYNAKGDRGTPSTDNTEGYGIALLAQNLIPKIQMKDVGLKNGNMYFDKTNNSNNFDNSEISTYLNETFLGNNFSGYTKGQMLNIPYKHTGDDTDYKHKVSLPSATEMGASHPNIKDYDKGVRPFEKWKDKYTENPGVEDKNRENDGSRAGAIKPRKKTGGTHHYYWTRTPNSHSSSYVWLVNSDGYVYNNYASYGSVGLAPLLNLKSDTRVKRVGQTSDNPAVYEIVETPPLQEPKISSSNTTTDAEITKVTITFDNEQNTRQYSTNNGKTWTTVSETTPESNTTTITIHKNTTIIAKETDSTDTSGKTFEINNLTEKKPTFDTPNIEQTQTVNKIGNTTVTIPIKDINELGQPLTDKTEPKQTILTREFITNGSQIVEHLGIDVPTVITVNNIDRSPTLTISNDGVIKATNILTDTPYENTKTNKAHSETLDNKIYYKIGDSEWTEYNPDNQPKLALHETAVFKIYDKYNISWTSTITNTPTTLNTPVFKQQVDGWTNNPHKTLILHDGIKSSGLKYRVEDVDDGKTHIVIPEDKTQSTPKSDEQGWVIYNSIGPKILEVPVSKQGQIVEVVLLDSNGNPTKDEDKTTEDKIYRHTVSNIDVTSPEIKLSNTDITE